MKKKKIGFGRFLGEIFVVILLFSFCLHAQNYNSQDNLKTDTTKSDTSGTKKDTLGYNNYNTGSNYIYAVNKSLTGSLGLLNSSKADTSKPDTSYKRTDSVGYNGSTNYILAFNNNSAYNFLAEDSSTTDTSKIDTLYKKSDKLGYNKIISRDYNYASKGNLDAKYYFQSNSSLADTSNPDSTKSDTLGYSRYNSNDYAFIDNYTYLKNDSTASDSSGGAGQYKTDTTKTDTMGYYKSNSFFADSRIRSEFSVYPIKDLTQKLKVNIYLMDEQTPKIQDILREYEARTYKSNGDHEEINEAARNAQENIANMLTARQKEEWENTKNEWWASVNQALNLSYFSKNINRL